MEVTIRVELMSNFQSSLKDWDLLETLHGVTIKFGIHALFFFTSFNSSVYKKIVHHTMCNPKNEINKNVQRNNDYV